MKASIIPNELDSAEFQPYFKNYIELAGERNVLESLEQQVMELQDLFGGLSERETSTIHEPYQWTLKQVVGHIIDVERVFGCRAHRIACRENQPLPGFDQNIFVDNTNYEHVGIGALLKEFESVRLSNIMMFDRWTEVMWQQSGVCDGKTISVRAIACLLVGHVVHHLKIVRQRLGDQ